MQFHFNERAKELFALTLWEAIKGILGLLLAAAAGVLAYTQSHLVHSNLLASHPYFFGGVCGILLSMVVRLVYKMLVFKPQFQSLDCDYLLLSKAITFAYQDEKRATYTKKLEVQALRSGLQSYHDKFRWTGKDPVRRIESAINGQTVKLTNKRNVWQYYEVQFPKTLKRKEKVVIEVKFEIVNPLTAVPFISATIDEPTNILTFSLSFPRGWNVTECTCDVLSTMTMRIPNISEIQRVDGNGKTTWTIKKPKLLHHYEMKWGIPKEINEHRKISAAAGK